MSIEMTSLVTGSGLLPLPLGGGEPGRAIEGQRAIVILGGFAISRILDLTIVSMFALHAGHFATAMGD